MSDTVRAEKADIICAGYTIKVSSEKSRESNLIELAKTDSKAFGELYDIYYASILNYIFRCTLNIDTSEELTSNTFFNALNALPKYRHNASFRAWLYSIATNEIKISNVLKETVR